MVNRNELRIRGMDKNKLELSSLIQHFELHNRTEGKSASTVEWYNQTLGLFLDWLEGEGMSTQLQYLGEDEVREFILYLQGRKGLWGAVSSYTLNNRVRGLRAFFNWLYRRGYTEEHRLQLLKPPKVIEKVIEPLTQEEIGRIFDSMNPNTVLGARNMAIYSLMLDTGLRLSEVVTLKDEDVHLQDRYIKVLGKGNKERIVAFGTTCQRWLVHYSYHYRIEPTRPNVDSFFLSIDGFALSPSALRSLTERLSKTSRVPRLHPHLLRHTYATQFLLNGGDVFLLKQNLGHRTLVMVENYVHMASRMAAIRSEGFSPLDRSRCRGPGGTGMDSILRVRKGEFIPMQTVLPWVGGRGASGPPPGGNPRPLIIRPAGLRRAPSGVRSRPPTGVR